MTEEFTEEYIRYALYDQALAASAVDETALSAAIIDAEVQGKFDRWLAKVRAEACR